MTRRSTTIDLVRDYVAAAQRARASRSAADFAAVRAFLADDFTAVQAGSWSDTPWRVLYRDADSFIARLEEPSNAASSLRTETVNLVHAGDDVLVEQVSTLTRDGVAHTSAVCHLFTVENGQITRARLYRNDAGLPTG